MIKLSFAKTVTLDTKSIEFVNFLMEELSTENFSQALRIAVTYAKIYKLGTSAREVLKTELAVSKYRIDNYIKDIEKSGKLFKEIDKILIGRWSDKQKIAKLKEIL